MLIFTTYIVFFYLTMNYIYHKNIANIIISSKFAL